ncbi:MAG: nuclear transport factor 2 family protein [Acidimicrobiales bacterium]
MSPDATEGSNSSMNELARQIRLAYETGDLELFGALLARNVTWGPPGDPSPPCQSKSQVLAWYQKGAYAGARATVQEMTAFGNRLLVGLVVKSMPASKEMGGQAPRWQVLTIEGSQIVDIVGFTQKSEATDWLSTRG